MILFQIALQQAIDSWEMNSSSGMINKNSIPKVILDKKTLDIKQTSLIINNDKHVLVSVTAPKGVRSPFDVVTVFDKSGSMHTEAKNSHGERDFMSYLDIVKHANSTIIESLTEEDRLGAVAFSSNAEILFELTPMDQVGKMMLNILFIHKKQVVVLHYGMVY